MSHFKTIAETRLSVRLKGALAEHVNQQIESSLYESHSEYIRDLIRKDMKSNSTDDSQDTHDTMAQNALKSIEENAYFEVTDEFWNQLSSRNRQRIFK